MRKLDLKSPISRKKMQKIGSRISKKPKKIFQSGIQKNITIKFIMKIHVHQLSVMTE
jgi:hypothetical protein